MIDELKTFIAVVEKKSFTKTSKVVNLSQPSVSLHISNLESYFSTVLIERSNKQKNMIVTPTGKILYNNAKQILSVLKYTKEEISSYHNGPTGILKIGATMTIGEFLLPSMLGDFIKEFPNIKLEVSIESTQNIYDKFKNYEFDIALSEGAFPLSNYRNDKFYKDTMVIAASKNNSLAHKKSLTIKDLSNETWITREEASGPAHDLKTFLKNTGIHPKNFIMFGSNYAVKEAVKNNLGISLISSLVIDTSIKNEELALLRTTHDYTRYFSYIVHDENTLSNISSLFLDKLLKTFINSI